MIGGRTWSVKIQARSGTRDSLGEKANDWSTVIDGYHVLSLGKNVKEYFSDARVQSDVDYMLTGLYRSEIDAGKRVVYGSRVFDVVGAFLCYPEGYTGVKHLRIYVKERH